MGRPQSSWPVVRLFACPHLPGPPPMRLFPRLHPVLSVPPLAHLSAPPIPASAWTLSVPHPRASPGAGVWRVLPHQLPGGARSLPCPVPPTPSSSPGPSPPVLLQPDPSRPLPHTLRLFRPLRPVPCDLCPRPFLCALTLPREPCTPCSHVSPCHAMFPLSHHASPAGPSAPPRCPLRVPGPPARAPRAPHPPRVLRPAPAELWELRAQEVAGRRGRGRRAAGRAGGRMGAGGGGRRTR